MPTPTTTDTAYSIICDACWDACLLSTGDEPDGELLAMSLRRLNQLVRQTMTDTQELWLWQDTAIPLTAGLGQYVLGPGGNVASVPLQPANIRGQYYLYSAADGGTRRPITRISRDEWNTLSVVSQQGPITQIFVDPQQTVMKVNTWLVPDANEAAGTLQLDLLVRVTEFVGVTDGMNFPVEWAMYLHWALASEICQGQPPAVIARCDAKAAFYLEKLSEWDVEQETSIMPQPDPRMFGDRRFGR